MCYQWVCYGSFPFCLVTQSSPAVINPNIKLEWIRRLSNDDVDDMFDGEYSNAEEVVGFAKQMFFDAISVSMQPSLGSN